VSPLEFDARGWLVWLAAAATVTLAVHNPLYTLILLAATGAVGIVCAQPDTGFSLPLARIGLVILFFTTLFNALTVHVGNTVLFRLPGNWLWIGGPVTGEAAVGGVGNGLVLFTLLVVFTTLNRVVASSNLVRFAPRALRDLAVVLLIAITYAPETLAQLRRIREAQAIRGHRVRGWRDWRPVLIPLLIGGLERAMGVAEAMVARGYGATADSRQPFMTQLALLAGLAAAFAGWVISFWVGWPGWVLMGGGAAVIGLLLRRWGRQTPFTRYRQRPFSPRDVVLMGTAVLPLLFLVLPLPFVDKSTLSYTPYPQLTAPGFDLWLGFSILLFNFPALAGWLDRQNPAAAPQVHGDDHD